MIDFIKTYIKYILFHKWNKVSMENFHLLDTHWKNKPIKGAKLWLYNKIKRKNNLFFGKCFSCVHCEQTPTCMQCTHKNKNINGRGKYCYPNSYDDCDCGKFKLKK